MRDTARARGVVVSCICFVYCDVDDDVVELQNSHCVQQTTEGPQLHSVVNCNRIIRNTIVWELSPLAI